MPAPSSSLIDRVHGQSGGSPRAVELGLTGQECLLRALSRVPDPRDARGVRHQMPAVWQWRSRRCWPAAARSTRSGSGSPGPRRTRSRPSAPAATRTAAGTWARTRRPSADCAPPWTAMLSTGHWGTGWRGGATSRWPRGPAAAARTERPGREGLDGRKQQVNAAGGRAAGTRTYPRCPLWPSTARPSAAPEPRRPARRICSPPSPTAVSCSPSARSPTRPTRSPHSSRCCQPLDLTGFVITRDAMHAQRANAHFLREDTDAHYHPPRPGINQPTLVAFLDTLAHAHGAVMPIALWS